jgi:ATP-dependent Clp protease protease subunit
MGCSHSSVLRKIFLTGKVDAEMAAQFDRSLGILSSKGKDPITVVINSSGGYCDSGFAIVDGIRSSPVQVNTHVAGDAMSMAALILAAGRRRTSGRHASIMIHQCSFRVNGTYLEMIQGEFAVIQRTQETYLNIMSQLTGQPAEKFADLWKSTNVYLTPVQAMELGMIDEVTEWVPLKESL